MLCKKCGDDLSDPRNVKEITTEHAAHDEQYIDLVMYCRCGAMYNTFVYIYNMMLIEEE